MAEVEDTQENMQVCMQGNCSSCPSYPQAEGGGLYCARGPSSVSIEKKGCNCPECPVWTHYGLSGMYYCANNQ
jgi:hypothetical protein